MASRQHPSEPGVYIIHIESSPETEERIWAIFETYGIKPDRDYGLIPIDSLGRRRIARVIASENALHRLERHLPITFYPELTIQESGSM
jgi:hypothetical protein